MDGTAGPDYGTFFTMDSNIVPDDDSWYRCTLPVAALIPGANTSSVQKRSTWRGMGFDGWSEVRVHQRSPKNGYPSRL